MDQKKLDKIYQLYNMNYTYKCIATDVGISAESVRYYVKKGITNNKLKPRGRVNSRKVTRFDETILDLYNNDYTNKEIAENFFPSIISSLTSPVATFLRSFTAFVI